MAGNKCRTSLNIRPLKFWGLSCRPTTSKMELEKFLKGIVWCDCDIKSVMLKSPMFS